MARSYGGTDAVPFYEYYFAGGAQSVRGFRANSIGPREGVSDDNRFNNTIGGTKKLIAVAELFLPNPFAPDSKSVRFAAFVDSGGVWRPGQRPKFDDISAAYGIGFTWIAPIGALRFSWAWPLKTQETDETERFQFSIGAPF